jgi:hypothetical protein
MTVHPAGVNPELSAREKTELIRDAIEGEIGKLGLAIAAMVRAVDRGRAGIGGRSEWRRC